MKIHEYQAKSLFREKGIPVPAGQLAKTADQAASIADSLGYPVVMKSQVHTGGRGKAGGIRIARDHNEALETARALFGLDIKGHKVRKLLVEKTVDIAKEIYLGIVVDRSSKCPLLMVSAEGGVEIEEIAATRPEAIKKFPIHPLSGLQPGHVRAILSEAPLPWTMVVKTVPSVLALYRLFIEKDCSLAEINPFVFTKTGEAIALDGKINFDDSAIYRHPELLALRDVDEEDPIERKANEEGLNYVKLDGTIGILGNGAGLVMTTLDVVKSAGGSSANFLDIGGGANRETVKKALKIILEDPDVKGILVNIFGGITRCDEVASGVVSAMSERADNIPVAVRLTGTNEEEGRRILAEKGYRMFPTMQEAARYVVQEVENLGCRRARTEGGF